MVTKGMRIGGIDPSILRELSGVYKPFVKAFKELISNAFDADADNITVECADDFSSITVIDDGSGMTPFEFRNDFARIGGGSRRWAGDRTRKGRQRIGSKGIGFLALARYCDRLYVESTSHRDHAIHFNLERTPYTINLYKYFGVPLPVSEMISRVKLNVFFSSRKRRLLRVGKDFIWNRRNGMLSILKNVGSVSISVKIRCFDIRFRACLDFEKLLKLADVGNLEDLDDFASVSFFQDNGSEPSGTKIFADGLKPFVRRELRCDRKKGFVRNIGSRSGFESFKWQLSRCTPIPLEMAPDNQNKQISRLLAQDDKMLLRSLVLRHGSKSVSLARPIYPFEKDARTLPYDMLIPIEINHNGLVATGFLAAYESVIFPAEYRGISIRVRGIAIGDPGFLGAEHILTGASKAALSQITGEIIVSSGLDAVDTLNPGRESFYEESEHFKILRKCLLGEGESITGYLGKAISAVLRRSHVRCSLNDVLSKAATRRQALDDVSAAITHLIAQQDESAKLIQRMLRSKRSHVNGLGAARQYELDIPPRIAGLRVIRSKHLDQPAVIDYASEQVLLDLARSEWDWSLMLFDRRFHILHKKGTPDQPIAELDIVAGQILINWNHPVKMHLDERGFIRTALSWILAKESACGDSTQMMNLALELLSFSTVNG